MKTAKKVERWQSGGLTEGLSSAVTCDLTWGHHAGSGPDLQAAHFKIQQAQYSWKHPAAQEAKTGLFIPWRSIMRTARE
eukprot:1156297-Pelagomonas_calceolata.AAC.6